MALVGNISGSGGIANTIGITGSLIIANPGLAAFPPLPGNDAVFFVSGAIDGKTAGSRTVAVFGGDTVISGSLTVGTGSVKLTSNDIQFGAFGTRIEKNGNNLTFFDASNTGGLTLSQLNAGGGGGTGTNFFTEGPTGTPTAGVIYNSGSVAFTGARTGETISAASQKGADVIFYFSGSKATLGTADSNVAMFGGNVVTSGSYSVRTTGGTVASIGNDGIISGSSNLLAGGSLTVAGTSTLTGNVTTAGNLAVNGSSITTSTPTFSLLTGATTLNVGTSSTSITIGGTSTTTSIFGNLYVSGTVVSVDSTNLKVSDPIILVGSGSVGPSAKSAIAFSSGSTAGLSNGSLIFGSLGGNDVLAAARQNVDNGNLSQAALSFTDLVPVRASQFQVGSAVANVSSSDGVDILITGSLVSLRHTLTTPTNGRPVPFGVDILGGSILGGSIRVTTSGLTPTLNINAHDGGGVPRALIASGSAVTINAASSDSSNGVVIQGAAAPLTRFYGSTNNTFINLLGTNDNLIDATTGGAGNLELSLSGSNINLKHGTSGGKGITLQRGNTKYGDIQYVSDGPRTYAQFSNNSLGSNNVRIGTAVNGANSGIINLSGSIVEVLASGGAVFQTLGTSTSYLTAQSGSYANPAGTIALNAAKIESTPNIDLLLGSQTTTHVSGSSIRMTVGGTNNVALQSDGTTFLTFASGSTNAVTIGAPSAFTANVINTGPTTVNAFGAATTLSIANTATAAQTVNLGASSTGASTYNLATGATGTGVTKAINLGTGGAAGSTTNITLGSGNGGTTTIKDDLTVEGNTTLGNASADTITFTARAASNLVPTSNYAYDLGSVDLRWKNIYTGDLHLKNDRGNWTIVEESEFLTITNNLNGKRYKFVLEEL